MLRFSNWLRVFTGSAVGSVKAGKPKRTASEESEGESKGGSSCLVGVAAFACWESCLITAPFMAC